jgi:folate-binding protein YgfZ
MSNAIAICQLASAGLLSVASNDNLKFLQGQLTCDLKEVSAEQWRYGALCTNKGRMISNFLLAQTAPNRHLLRMHRSTIEAVETTLKKFAPFYKGTVQDQSADYIIVGIAADAETALDGFVQGIFSTHLSGINAVKTTEQFTLVKLDKHRYECWINKNAADSYWQKSIAAASVTDETQWELLNIRAGLGEVRKATIEEWTPHMLNLQAVGAISFKKGCYTGQEIVARTEYRGQQKRAMYHISGTGAVPATATALTGGEIVMAQATSADKWEALAVLSDKDLEHTTLSCAGYPVQILDLPYAIRKTISATP